MCNYNGRIVSRAEFIRLMELEKQLELLQGGHASISGFDYSDWPVIRPVIGKRDIEVVGMEWGFLPDTWYKRPIDTRAKAERFRKGFPDLLGNPKPGITTLNATAEELLMPGKIYRESALTRRCLILSPGFYEWRHVYRTNKRTGEPLKTPDKYPYRIKIKDQNIFYMAGIWKPWTDKETGESVETFSIVTTSANPLMKIIHNSKERMPTILPENLAADWIFGNLTEERITEIAKFQYPAEQMEAYTVRKKFREEGDPNEPFTYADLPEVVL